MDKKKYYTSIDDLPIWNWWKVSETGNLIYLHKKEDYDDKDYSIMPLWESINDEYFNKYGINDNLRRLMELKKKWIAKKRKLIVDGKRFALTELVIIESKMRELEQTPSVNNEESIIFLEEKLGREIDPKRISVKKYYDYIRYYG